MQESISPEGWLFSNCALFLKHTLGRNKRETPRTVRPVGSSKIAQDRGGGPRIARYPPTLPEGGKKIAQGVSPGNRAGILRKNKLPGEAAPRQMGASLESSTT